MIELGLEGKDQITGFKGIVTARHQYITGCDQYTLSPKKQKDGSLSEQYQFDEGRIEIIGKGINKKKVAVEVPGGPQRMSKSAK